jgi:hypothetical protein
MFFSLHDYGTHALVQKNWRKKLKKAGKRFSAPSKTTVHTLSLEKKKQACSSHAPRHFVPCDSV